MYVHKCADKINTFKNLSCPGHGVSFFQPPGSLRQKDSKLQVSLGYRVSLKAALATQPSTASNTKMTGS